MAVNKLDNSMIDPNDIGTSANQLVQLDGSTKIPAVDGALLTGIPVAFTKSANDPVIATNPSGGVGTIWVNTTSGETYCCTDATAGANVWTNIGEGTDNIQPWLFQGTAWGYHYGSGDQDNGSIQKVSFTSDGNATDVGSVTVARDTWTGTHSDTHGYCSGGYVGGTSYNIIERNSFATDGNSVDVGDLVATIRAFASSCNKDYGYTHGGYPHPGVNVIQRFQQVATANATDVGDLTFPKNLTGGNSDVGNSYGYATGGYYASPPNNYGGNEIERYAMASSGNAVDVGDMHTERAAHASHSTETYGYQAGGGEPSVTNAIRKFAFGSSVTSTDVANLTVARFHTTEMSSTTYGYSVGGIWPDALNTTIDKFSFAADADATDVGDLATAGGRYNGPTGAQY